MIPIKYDTAGVGIIILAAGASKRMGQPKQMLPFQDSNLLQHTIKAAVNSVCNPIVLVLGANIDIILPQVLGNPIHIVENKEWEEGMASSLRTGLNKMLLLNKFIESVVILLCDQPFISSDQINKLVEASHITRKSIIISEYEQSEGVPALFNKEHFHELQHLKGKEGAKKLLKLHKDCTYKVPFPQGLIDIDTPEDYKNVMNDYF
ncbi:MAG: nucleotidyltransferase family protein [Bacteroidota bacterium]|jgi:molybdenum cofactor cytidylyltransferase|nr:nucleotidyltransferase family protein [Bacteroidota bacterium]